jgi:carboxymethylenebutenolidase
VKLREEEIRVPAGDHEIRTTVIVPQVGVNGGPADRAVLFYSDIFQRTESTLRTARRLAASGFVVVVPDLYPRGELSGVALAFDDPGKAAGLAGAEAMTTAEFDADRIAVLDQLAGRGDLRAIFAVGFCLGGHLAFRAGFDDRVAATVCFYPTGLQDGALGGDDADTLGRAGEIAGRLMVIFGSQDPHVSADARLYVFSAIYAAGLTDTELHIYRGGEHAFMRDVGARHDPSSGRPCS